MVDGYPLARILYSLSSEQRGMWGGPDPGVSAVNANNPAWEQPDSAQEQKGNLSRKGKRGS